MPDTKIIKLEGRVFLTFDIETVTGLHIGGSDTGIEIGGVDKTVIRDRLTNRPYIPGSSLKGKMRSLLEKYQGLPQNQRIGQGYIHSAQDGQEYRKYPLNLVFGVSGERDFATPTRLVVRDTHMSDESATRLNESGRTDLPFTEVKTEVSIDRVTSAANPRQMERVPAGAIFGGVRKMKNGDNTEREIPQPAEIIYSIYSGDGCDKAQDIANFEMIVNGLSLLEDDYLGGLGSRGSGKVRLRNIRVRVRTNARYLAAEPDVVGQDHYDNLKALVSALPSIKQGIQTALGA